MYNIKIICYFAQEIDSVNIITSWKTCFFHQLSTHSAMLPQSFLGYMNVKCQSVFVRSSVDLGSHIHSGMGLSICTKLARVLVSRPMLVLGSKVQEKSMRSNFLF